MKLLVWREDRRCSAEIRYFLEPFGCSVNTTTARAGLRVNLKQIPLRDKRDAMKEKRDAMKNQIK